MRNAVVHIGLNKTGSSTIQSWLGHNRQALLEQGVKYDTFSANPETPAHIAGFTALGQHLSGVSLKSPITRHQFGIQTREDQNRVMDAFQEELIASIETNDYDRYVITSEVLHRLGTPHGKIEVFRDFLHRFFTSVQFVVYFRNQIDWYPSEYTQLVRSGRTLSLDAFIKTSKTQDYFRIAERWHKAVGAENLSVRLLERDFLTNGDLIEDFASVIGVDPVGLAQIDHHNVGLSKAQLAAMRRMNQIISHLPKRLQIKYQTRFSSKQRGTAQTKTISLTRSQAEDIAQRHAVSNEKLRAKFFPQRPVLFQKSASMLTTTPSVQMAASSSSNTPHTETMSGSHYSNQS